MLRPSLLLLSALCISKAIAIPHQAVKHARDADIPPPDSTSTGVAGPTTGSTSASTTLTGMTLQTTTGTSGVPNLQSSTSTIVAPGTTSTSTSLPGPPVPTTTSTSTKNRDPPQASTNTLTIESTRSGQPNNPTENPDPLHPTHTTQSDHLGPTKSMTGGSHIETLVVMPGGHGILSICEDNLSPEIMFVEVHLSTKFGTGSANRPTNTFSNPRGPKKTTSGAGSEGTLASTSTSITDSAEGQATSTSIIPTIPTSGVGGQGTLTSTSTTITETTGESGGQATSTSISAEPIKPTDSAGGQPTSTSVIPAQPTKVWTSGY